MDEKQKKQLMIGGGIAGGLAIIGLLYVMFSGGGDSSGATDTTTGPPTTGGGQAGRQTQRPPNANTGQPEQAISANPANPGAPGGKTDRALQLASVLPGHKSDPFYFERHIVIPPPNVFDQVTPITVTKDDTKPPVREKGIRVRVVPTKRVSGLMTGDGVYAILESVNGEVEIVKPGSKTKDGYTVTAINPDSVDLEQEDPRTKTIYTQRVMFSDAPVSSTPGGGRGGNGGPGGPNGPGGGPPGGPPPGAPGGGGDGGG